MKPYVIVINAVSGGGKTALTTLLATTLPNAVRFHFDDFDETNVYPSDYYEWTVRGADLLEFDCPGMAAAVEREIEAGRAQFIILDYPFSRDHPRLKTRIDLSVFVDTPLDVAMARRILRDECNDPQLTADKKWEGLRTEMAHYVSKARHAFLDTYRHKRSSDLILDGWTTLDRLCAQIVEYISALPSENRPNQPAQRNAGVRPYSGDSSASEIPSSLGPRG